MVPQWVIKKINKSLFNFIWDSKEKVKRTTVIREIKHGGLNAPDIESIFMTLKSKWIERICAAEDNAHWPFYIKQIFTKWGIDKTIKCLNSNLNNMPFLNNIPFFYKEVLNAYCISNVNSSLHSRQTILNQSIWGNTNFKNTQNKCIYFAHWIKSGIIYMSDLKIINGKISKTYLYQKLKQKNNYLCETAQLKQAVSRYCNIIAENRPENKIQTMPNIAWSSKTAYQTLVNMKSTEPICKDYWKRKNQNKESDFNILFLQKCKQIKDGKLCEFNYKLIHNILICRDKLKKMGLSETDLCSHCGEVENSEHLLIHCKVIKEIWEKIAKILKISRINTYELILANHILTTQWVISLLQYLFFKRWVLTQNNICSIAIKDFVCQEITVKLQLYRLNKYCELCTLLEKIIAVLRFVITFTLYVSEVQFCQFICN